LAAPDVSHKNLAELISLSGRRAVVTGGARGIGRASAERLAEAGAQVVLGDLDGDAAVTAAGEIAANHGVDAHGIEVEVASSASLSDLADRAVELMGGIDIWVNNAGIYPSAPVLELDHAEWDRVMAVNVRGVFLGCKYAIPKMVEQGSGSIINISSFVALMGCSNPQDAYTASKGAVLALTKSLAVQFAPKGVRTNAICPGPVETPLLMDWLVKDEDAKRIRLARNPTGRFGKPEEIVFMAMYLASDESRWTNGAAMVVDGGITVNYF
jgi:NAD(P)-dependent dehydrogenase (short-subunit alcohol dehydrogenase family)